MENYLEDPYDMDKFFRNFENPLEFSANENIVRLKENYEQCKAEMEEEQKKIAEFSKTIYKKIITQDNDYSFKADSRSTKGEDIEILFNKKNLKASSHAEIVKLSSLKLSDEKEFRHNESEEIEGEESVSKVGVKFSFQDMKLIDSDEFDSKCKNFQFYELVKAVKESVKEKEKNQVLIPENEELPLEIRTLLNTFEYRLVTRSQTISKMSHQIYFDTERELHFCLPPDSNALKEFKEESILSTCAFLDPKNITFFDQLDFAAKLVDQNDIKRFYLLKTQLMSNLEKERNQKDLQDKYNELKERIRQLKEQRSKSSQRLPSKPKDAYTFMVDENKTIEEKDFEQYFLVNGNDIFARLDELNLIRDDIITSQSQETMKVMVTNISLEIYRELYKLLFLIIKNENAVDIHDILHANSEEGVERKILQNIYIHFSSFTDPEGSTIKKYDMVKRYLDQREKNQRFYQAYLFKQAKNKRESTTNFKRNISDLSDKGDTSRTIKKVGAQVERDKGNMNVSAKAGIGSIEGKGRITKTAKDI